MTGGSGALAAGSGEGMGAESPGEGEGGGFGVAGRSEAIRGLGYGVVASARTNAEAGYPLMTRELLAARRWAMVRRVRGERSSDSSQARALEAQRGCSRSSVAERRGPKSRGEEERDGRRRRGAVGRRSVVELTSGCLLGVLEGRRGAVLELSPALAVELGGGRAARSSQLVVCGLRIAECS